jgi:hypothetical protein
VDDPGAVCSFEPGRDPAGESQHVIRLQGLCRDELLQSSARDILELEAPGVGVTGRVNSIESDDVGVVELAGETRLSQNLVALAHLGPDDFERDLPADQGVAGEIDGPERAPSDLPLDREFAEPAPRLQVHDWILARTETERLAQLRYRVATNTADPTATARIRMTPAFSSAVSSMACTRCWGSQPITETRVP